MTDMNAAAAAPTIHAQVAGAPLGLQSRALEVGAVSGALSYQADALSRLEQLLELLTDRLAPVLRQPAPTPAMTGSGAMATPADPQPPCAIAQEIGGRSQRIEAASEQVGRLLERIDV